VAIDGKRLFEVFSAIGKSLEHPAMLCLIGSAPAIHGGQPERQTQDIDVWGPQSNFDQGDLADACRRAGILFNPKGEISPDDLYLQIIQPGAVSLPVAFEPEIISRFGKLTVAMAPPAIAAASKLTRAAERDLADIVWWLRSRKIDLSEIEAAISLLPKAMDRDAATGNLTIVRLIVGKAR
jgi:hypothetical protein